MSRLDPNLTNEILERCLRELQAGQDIEGVLNLYPAYKDELRPILEAMQAVWASKGSDTVPVAAMARSRARLMKAVYELKQAPPQSWWQRQFVFMRHSMIPVVTALVCFGMLFTGLASAKSLPGQALYPVKIAAEQVVLSLPASPSTQLAREENYDARRKGEVEELIGKQDHQEVSLTGVLSQNGANWRVDVLEVVIPAALAEKAAGLNGQYVAVHAELTPDGQMSVESIDQRFYTIAGRIQKLEPNRAQIEDMWVQIGADTEVNGILEAGVKVDVAVVRIANDRYLAVKINQVGVVKSTSAGEGQKKKSTQAVEIQPTEIEVQPEHTPDAQNTPMAEPQEDTEKPAVTATATHEDVQTPVPTSTRLAENSENIEKATSTPEVENNSNHNQAPTATQTPRKDHESRPTATPEHKGDEHSKPGATPTHSSDD